MGRSRRAPVGHQGRVPRHRSRPGRGASGPCRAGPGHGGRGGPEGFRARGGRRRGRHRGWWPAGGRRLRSGPPGRSGGGCRRAGQKTCPDRPGGGRRRHGGCGEDPGVGFDLERRGGRAGGAKLNAQGNNAVKRQALRGGGLEIQGNRLPAGDQGPGIAHSAVALGILEEGGRGHRAAVGRAGVLQGGQRERVERPEVQGLRGVWWSASVDSTVVSRAQSPAWGSRAVRDRPAEAGAVAAAGASGVSRRTRRGLGASKSRSIWAVSVVEGGGVSAG